MLKASQSCLNILDLIKCTHYVRYDERYIITHAYPTTGILHITDTSPFFITGKLKKRWRKISTQVFDMAAQFRCVPRRKSFSNNPFRGLLGLRHYDRFRL